MNYSKTKQHVVNGNGKQSYDHGVRHWIWLYVEC